MDDSPANSLITGSHLAWFGAFVALSIGAVLYDARISSALMCFTAGHPGLERAARFVTDWGNYVFYVGFGLMFIIGLASRDAALVRVSLVYGLTLLIFSLAAGHLIKTFVGRPRPFVGADASCRPLALEARYESFPSGHTSDAFAAVVPAFGWLKRAWLKAAVILWAGLIGLSRILLGQHYPTDVMAGVALGVGGGLLLSRLLAGLRLPLLGCSGREG